MSKAFLLHFYFSGVQESKSEVVDISNLSWPEQDFVHLAFVQSGFADDHLGRYKLLPCPLGTFAESSLTDPNCKNCSAGKLQLFILHYTFQSLVQKMKKKIAKSQYKHLVCTCSLPYS